MIRTQIYLREAEKEALRQLSQYTGKTQSELIRQAIDAFIAQFTPPDKLARLRQGRGLWRDRDDLPDFRALRGELERGMGEPQP